MFSQTELEILSDYFNRQADLPEVIQTLADRLKDELAGQAVIPVDESIDEEVVDESVEEEVVDDETTDTSELGDEPTLPGEDDEVIDEASEI